MGGHGLRRGLRHTGHDPVAQLPRSAVRQAVLLLDAAGDPRDRRGVRGPGRLAGGSTMKQTDKQQVQALLDKLPDDATFADIQRAIAVLMWPKRDDGSLAPPQRLEPDEVKRRLREWLKSESDK